MTHSINPKSFVARTGKLLKAAGYRHAIPLVEMTLGDGIKPLPALVPEDAAAQPPATAKRQPKEVPQPQRFDRLRPLPVSHGTQTDAEQIDGKKIRIESGGKAKIAGLAGMSGALGYMLGL